jgi:hypothetical protein
MASSTRSKQDVYLLGSSVDCINGAKLPSIGDVLRLYITKLKSSKNKHQAAVSVIAEIQLFWDKAKIPMRRSDHAVVQLEELVQKWERLKKNKARRTNTQIANEETFTATFNDLFDVAHQNALEMLKVEEDKHFLLAQREKGRRGVMAGVDVSLTRKEEAKRVKQERQLQLKKKQQLDIETLERNVLLETCDSSSVSDETDETQPSDELEDYNSNETMHPFTTKRKRGITNILTPSVLSSLDRTKTSDRYAVQIIAPVIQATGHNIEHFSISRSSIRRYRQKNRLEFSLKLKSEFNPQKPLVLHWDGKLMQDLTGDNKVDRLPIIVSGSGTEQLLCVPKLCSGTGLAMAEALMDTGTVKVPSVDVADGTVGHLKQAMLDCKRRFSVVALNTSTVTRCFTCLRCNLKSHKPIECTINRKMLPANDVA